MFVMKRKTGVFVIGIVFLILGVIIFASAIGSASDKTKDISSYYGSSSARDMLVLPEYIVATNGVLLICTGIILMAVSEERQYRNNTNNSNYPIQGTPIYNNSYVCPNCHTAVPKSSVFCQGCGFKLNQTAFINEDISKPK